MWKTEEKRGRREEERERVKKQNKTKQKGEEEEATQTNEPTAMAKNTTYPKEIGDSLCFHFLLSLSFV